MSANTKFCEDLRYPDGTEVNVCCDSCHQDTEYGYDLLCRTINGEVWEACCAVMKELERLESGDSKEQDQD